jgi:hypothetical protein
MSDNLSFALRTYLGAGGTGGYLPYGETARMESAFPGSAHKWVSRFTKYLELDHPPSDWNSSDLAQEQRMFEAKAARLFPELDAVAVNALACRWSYSWR